MTLSARLRVLATNDFVCSVDPRPASFGTLPGAGGLHDTIARLQDGVPALWLDAGDFAGWSPLASLSQGREAFAAATEFRFDATCAGNHEFDYGTGAIAEFARNAPYPVLCANVPSGLPATHVASSPAGDVGLLGITMPELGDLPALPSLVRTAISDLRAAGCTIVIVLLHDGISWTYGHAPAREADPADFLRKHGAWLNQADLVVAGHTLARFLGPLGGTIVVQPWAFGAEIAIVDFDADAGIGRVGSVMAAAGGDWRGPGRALIEQARERRYGSLGQAAACSLSGDRALPDLMASAVRVAASADAALVPAAFLATQPAVDGVTAWIPAGVVDELTIQRLAPYPDDQVYTCAVTQQECANLIREFTAPAFGSPGTPNLGGSWWQYLAGRSTTGSTRTELQLAVPDPWPKAVEQALNRAVAWSAVGVSLKQALRANLCACGQQP